MGAHPQLPSAGPAPVVLPACRSAEAVVHVGKKLSLQHVRPRLLKARCAAYFLTANPLLPLFFFQHHRHGLPERWTRCCHPRAHCALRHLQQAQHQRKRRQDGARAQPLPMHADAVSCARRCLPLRAEPGLPARRSDPPAPRASISLQGGLKGMDANKPAAYAQPNKNKLTSLFEEQAGSTKEPIEKCDLADVGNAQAVIPYMADIQRHYREAEVRHARDRPHTQPESYATPAERLLLLRSRPRKHGAGGAHGSRPLMPRADPQGPSRWSRPIRRALPWRWPGLSSADRRRVLCLLVHSTGHQPRVGHFHEQADRHQPEDARDPHRLAR